MKTQRLLKLASFLDKVHPTKFNFGTWVGGQERPFDMAKEPRSKGVCGTTACAIGWCPALWPDAWTWNTNALPVLARNVNSQSAYPTLQAAEWFGISEEMATAHASQQWPRNSRSNAPVAGFQRRTTRSRPPAISRVPSLEKANEHALPGNSRSFSPLVASQSVI